MSQHGNKKRSCTGKRILSMLIALTIFPVGAMDAGVQGNYTLFSTKNSGIYKAHRLDRRTMPC